MTNVTFQITNLREEERVYPYESFKTDSFVSKGMKYWTMTNKDEVTAIYYARDAIDFVDKYKLSINSQQEDEARALQNMLLNFMKRKGRLIHEDMPARADWSTLPLMDPPTYDQLEYCNLVYDIHVDEPEWEWLDPPLGAPTSW